MSKYGEHEFDLLVLGSGIAGTTAAITAAARGLRVGVLSKEPEIAESNTWYAQGGIVGPSDEDTPELLENDRCGALAREGGAAVGREPAATRARR